LAGEQLSCTTTRRRGAPDCAASHPVGLDPRPHRCAGPEIGCRGAPGGFVARQLRWPSPTAAVLACCQPAGL